MAGAIIGTGGSVMKSLCQMSGARISLMDKSNVLTDLQKPHRVLRIMGPFDSVQYAHELVFKFLYEGIDSTAVEPDIGEAAPGEAGGTWMVANAGY